MPLTKRSYSFHGKASGRHTKLDESDNGDIACVTGKNSTLRKIKTRGKSFIGRKGNNSQENEAHQPSDIWQRGSVLLRSFRKRKMADRDDSRDAYVLEKAKAFKPDPDDNIQRRIDDQIRIREGAMRLLSACGNLTQALDTSKNLNAINARVLALMSALQKKRSSKVLKDYNKRTSMEFATLKACKAKVTVRNIRIPLIWKDDAHYKERSGDPYLLYYMFCFLKMGDNVLDTVLTQIDHKDTDVTFEGPFVFESVPADFRLDFEIYYTVVINPDRAHSTAPMRQSRKNTQFITNIPKFCLAAHAQFDVHNISNTISTIDLNLGGQGAHATAVLGQREELPENPLHLWGQVSIQLAAQPSCMLLDQRKGTLFIQESNGGQPTWEQYVCTIKQCTMQCQKVGVPNGKLALPLIKKEIKLRKGMRVTESNLNGIGKDHVLILESDGEYKEPVLGFDSRGQCLDWKNALEDCIANIKAWGVACENVMEFQNRKIQLIQSSPKLSFYDQIILTPTNTSSTKDIKVNGQSEEKEEEAMDVFPEETVTDEQRDNKQVNGEETDDETRVDTESPQKANTEKLTDTPTNFDNSNQPECTEAAAMDSELEQISSIETTSVKTEEQPCVEVGLPTAEKAESALGEELVVEEVVAKDNEEDVKTLITKETHEKDLVCSQDLSFPCATGEDKVEDEKSTAAEDQLENVSTEEGLLNSSENVPGTTLTNTEEDSVTERGEPRSLCRVNTLQAMSAIASLDEMLDNQDSDEDDDGEPLDAATLETVGSSQTLQDEAICDAQRVQNEALQDAPIPQDDTVQEGQPETQEHEATCCNDELTSDSHRESTTNVKEAEHDSTVTTVEMDSKISSRNIDLSDTSNDPHASVTLDEDELLNQRLADDGDDNDEDELLNRKLNVYNGHNLSDEPSNCQQSEMTERKPYIETDF